MFEDGEVVRVLTAGIMDLLPEGGKIIIDRKLTAGPPEDERFCVQVDARDPDFYTLRVVPLSDAQRRQITGRTEATLRARIESDGWTMKVWHHRKTEHGPMMSKWRAKSLGYAILAKGGYTEVEITAPDGGRYFYGKAVCSPDDAYCRAEGRTIALDRAVRLYEAECFPTMAQLVEGGFPDGFSASDDAISVEPIRYPEAGAQS